jgi:hypothetical protein
LFVLDLLLTGYATWPGVTPVRFAPLGSRLLDFVLIALLGWKVFGPLLQN